MMHLQRRFLLSLSIVALSVSLIALSKEQVARAQASPVKIGYLMDTLKIERWQTDLDTFKKRAKELGAEVLVETAEGNDDLQLQQSQKLMDSGAKVLVLVPHDTDKAARIVSAAKTRHVPVICYERLVRNSDVDFFVGTNAEVIGELQASTLARLAAKGNYVLIGGSPADANARVLRDGQLRVFTVLAGWILPHQKLKGIDGALVIFCVEEIAHGAKQLRHVIERGRNVRGMRGNQVYTLVLDDQRRVILERARVLGTSFKSLAGFFGAFKLSFS